MGKPSAPAPPDYAAAAEATGQSSIDAIQAQTQANRPNQYTPWGSSTWTQNQQGGGGYQPPGGGQQPGGRPGGRGGGGPQRNQNMGYGGTGGGGMDYGGGGWEQTITLHPDQQRALDAQMKTQIARSEIGSDMTSRLQREMGQPMDWSQFGEAQKGPQGGTYQGGEIKQGVTGPDIQSQLDTQGLQGVDPSGRYNQAAGEALYGRATSRLDPQWEQRTAQKDVALRNQGLRPGDQAYDTAMTNLEQNKTDAYQQAGFGADIGAGQEAERMQGMDLGWRGQQFGERGQMGQFANQAQGQQFGQNLQGMNQWNQAQDQRFGQQLAGGQQQFQQAQQAAQFQNTQRNQAIAQEMQKRGMTLNEINAAMSGQQVGMPSMPGFSQAGAAQAVDYSGAAGQQFGAEMDIFGAKNAQQQAMMSGIGDLAGAGMAFSDRRLKSDIVPLGDGWYSYRLFGHIPTIGVMSDEVNPDAVVKHPSGFDMVNYGNL